MIEIEVEDEAWTRPALGAVGARGAEWPLSPR